MKVRPVLSNNNPIEEPTMQELLKDIDSFFYNTEALVQSTKSKKASIETRLVNPEKYDEGIIRSSLENLVIALNALDGVAIEEIYVCGEINTNETSIVLARTKEGDELIKSIFVACSNPKLDVDLSLEYIARALDIDGSNPQSAMSMNLSSISVPGKLVNDLNVITGVVTSLVINQGEK